MEGLIQVRAIKLTEDYHSIKVAYLKNGILFIRSGEDDFSKGEKSPSTLPALKSKWGFKSIQGNATFKNGKELLDSIDNFQLREDGTVQYVGG